MKLEKLHTKMSHEIKVDLEFEDSTKNSGKYLVVDIETTGLPINKNASPEDFKNWPYIVQIGWLLFDDEHKLIEHSAFYLKQSIMIPIAATKIHGITTEIMLEKGIEPLSVYNNFIKAIDNTEYIIAHNVNFDIPIIHCEFLRNGMRWDYPNNRIFCTMKTGMGFCKIPSRNGGLKFPTLAELYQKCFFSDKVVTGKIKGMHSAIIDAAMTAKCFFNLIELGFLEEFTVNATSNSLIAKQNEDNFEDLQEILEYEEYTEDYKMYYMAEIKHLGLGTFKVLKDTEKYRLDNKVEAQFKKWEEQWEKISQKNKLKTDKEQNFKIAEERTKDAQGKQKQIDDLLICALRIDNRVNWDSLKNLKKFQIPNPKNNLSKELNKIVSPTPPIFKELPKEPCKSIYEPQLFLIDKIFKSRKKNKCEQAETLYQTAMKGWEKTFDETNSFNANLADQYEQKLKELEKQKQDVNKRFDILEKEWERERESYNKKREEHNEKIEKIQENYFQRDTEAVLQYCKIVLNNSQYPETFPKKLDLNYNLGSKLLIVDYVLPAPDDLPTLTSVKYITAKKELKELFLSETQLSEKYDSAIYKIALRTLHELFKTDNVEVLDSIIFNGWVNIIDKATGNKIKNCIITMHVKKKEFIEIKLSNVDPKTCFKNLKGIGSKKLSDIVRVQPIAEINKNK